MDEASEAVAVEIAAQGVIGKRVDEMESGFIMALDYMIQLAEKDNDDKVTDEMFSLVLYITMTLLLLNSQRGCCFVMQQIYSFSH